MDDNIELMSNRMKHGDQAAYTVLHRALATYDPAIQSQVATR
jgi:hypothetical protein